MFSTLLHQLFIYEVAVCVCELESVFFFPIPARGGTSVVALPLFFLLNCEKWSAWAQVLEPGSGLCFFTHVLFNQKPSSLCSKCPFHYLAFMADVEGGSSLFKPATHVTNISDFMELIIKADQWAWGNAWVFYVCFFLPKVSNLVKQQLFTREHTARVCCSSIYPSTAPSDKTWHKKAVQFYPGLSSLGLFKA